MNTAAQQVVWRGAAAMAAVLAVSNWLVQFPLGEFLTPAAFTYPIAFLVTDVCNRAAGPAAARRVAALGFVFGVPLSFLFGWLNPAPDTAPDEAAFVAARIAAASGAAFLCAQLADVFIFNKMRRAAWWRAPFVSSAAASTLDTALFFSLAFAGTAAPWATLALGDLAAKGFMAFALLPPYRLLTHRMALLP